MSGSVLRPGDRVRIRALREIGSARVLNGLTGEVVEPHPIAIGWYKIRLDDNHITPHTVWSIPGDRLVRSDDPAQREATPWNSPPGTTVRHFP
ncbi:MAG TPA: hypothetical protein VN517_13225 [Terriglobales bacterium]|nr:hypothetical protein [Terriglobales bacterium]